MGVEEEIDTIPVIGSYKNDVPQKFFKQVVKPLRSSEKREKIEFVRTEKLNKRVWSAIKQQNPNLNTEEIVIGFIIEEYVADFGTIPIDADRSSLTPTITQEAKLFFSYFKITPPYQIFALNEEIPVSSFTPTNEASPVYSKALLEVATFLTKPTWQDIGSEMFNDVFEWIKRKQDIERENKLVEASLKDEFNKISNKRERFVTWSRAKEGLLAFARFSESLKGNYEGTGFAFTSENPEDWASNPNIPKGNAIFVEASAIVAIQAAMTSLGHGDAMSYDGKTLKIDPKKIPQSTRTLREEVVRKAYQAIDKLTTTFPTEAKLLILEKKLRQIGSTWELVKVCGVQRLEGENNNNTPIEGILKGNINLLKDYPQVDAKADNLKIVFYFAEKTNAQGETYNPNKTCLLLGSTDYDLVIDILDKIADKKQKSPNNCKITEEEANEYSPEILWSKIETAIKHLFIDQNDVNKVLNLYKKQQKLWRPLLNTIEELKLHGLTIENNIKLLNNIQYVEAQILREQGANINPIWKNNIDNYWLKPYHKDQLGLSASELLEIKKRKLVEYLTKKRDKDVRIIDEINIVFGRREAYAYTEKLDKNMINTNKAFIHDPSWVASGFVLSEVIRNNLIENAIQACETVKKLENWNIIFEGKIIKSKIYINLYGYNIYNMMQAMYTNPNKTKVDIVTLNDNPYRKTFVTDMEIANIVRNKDWFDKTEFIEVVNGEAIFLTKQEAEKKYGIKYIGNILKP